MPTPAPQSVNDLLELSDAAFVTAIYRALLGRNPDAEGMEQYLEALRGGVDKVTILAAVAGSQEARRVGTRIRGIEPLLSRHRLERLPIIGILWKVIGRLNDRSKMLNRLENRLGRIERSFGTLPVSEGQVLALGDASNSGDELAERLHLLEAAVYRLVTHGSAAKSVTLALEVPLEPAVQVVPVGPTERLLRMRRSLDDAVARRMQAQLRHESRVSAADIDIEIDVETDAEAGTIKPPAALSPQSRLILRQIRTHVVQDTELLTTPLEL